MTKEERFEELKELLKENLTIETDHERGSYGADEITSDFLDVPSRD